VREALPVYDPRPDGADCDHCPMRRWAAEDRRKGRNDLAGHPVPDQKPRGAPLALIVGEAPAKQEVLRGLPFAGAAGLELNSLLATQGVPRNRLHITNVIACRATVRWDGKDDYQAIERRLKADERAGRKLPGERHPAQHCRPRLERVVRRFDRIIALGGTAAGALLGGRPAIRSIMGGPVETEILGRTRKVLPTLHPASLLPGRDPRFRSLVEAHLRRAFRFFEGRLRWRDPLLRISPPLPELRRFLRAPSAYWTYDLETDAREPQHARIRCLALARDPTGYEKAQGYDCSVVVVGTRSCSKIVAALGLRCWDDVARIPRVRAIRRGAGLSLGAAGLRYLYEQSPELETAKGAKAANYRKALARDAEGAELGLVYPRRRDAVVALRLVERAMVDGRATYGWNSASYDKLVMLANGLQAPTNHDDGMGHDSLGDSEGLHALGVKGSLHTDIPAWKQDNDGAKLAWDARSDRELFTYGGLDAAVTHKLKPKVWATVVARGQDKPCPGDPSITLPELNKRTQEFACKLQMNGLPIDFAAQHRMVKQLEGRLADLTRKVMQLAPFPSFNPRSHPHVRRALFTRKGFGLQCPSGHYTDTGEASTGDKTLQQLIFDGGLSRDAELFIRTERKVRATEKALGMVRPLVRRSETYTTTAGEEREGIVDDDGRLRVSHNASRTLVGRLATGNPTNIQNWPKVMRALVRARPGYTLLGADYEQMHGRIMAARWGVKSYQNAYDTPGFDSHQLTMEYAYGDQVWGLPGAPETKYRKKGIGGAFKRTRDVIKTFFYAYIYGANLLQTVWPTLREVEADCPDCGGKGCRKCFGLGTVFPFADITAEEVVEIGERMARNCPEISAGWDSEVSFYKAHKYSEEPLGGRRRYFDNGYKREEVINFFALGSESFITNRASLRLMDAGWGDYCIQQGHDAIVLEVPEDRVDEAQAALVDAMEAEYRHIYDIGFPVEPDRGPTWDKV